MKKNDSILLILFGFLQMVSCSKDTETIQEINNQDDNDNANKKDNTN